MRPTSISKAWYDGGSGFKPASQLKPFCVEFACSPHACLGFIWVLRFFPSPKTYNLA